MLTIRTLLEIVHIIENWTTAELDRFAISFKIGLPAAASGMQLSKANKGNLILTALEQNEISGPFTDNLHLDAVQYILDKYIQDYPEPENQVVDPWAEEPAEEPEDNIDGRFTEFYTRLCNSLKRDGYTIKDQNIIALLPTELIEANTENELIRLLDHFNFATAKGHLEQAVNNHSNGNWAGANGQFRTYMESLMIEISNHLIPGRNCTDIGNAITWLSNSAIINPVLLHNHLNEVPRVGLNAPFINGLWKRLHPTGSHPGLSDEEDCTFRYHSLIVFTRYLLSRLENR